jgi:LCP family protein required for cell wall assembly
MKLGCSVIGIILLLLIFIGSVYLFFPARLNVLLLGVDDRTPEGAALGRSDTNILVTILPLRPYIGMLSIPRDLWVDVPGVGEQRINTAHFFAETNEPGSGPPAAMNTIQHNFGVDVRYYYRIQFGGLVGIVDALGGLNLTLEEPMGNLPAGEHLLDGEQALAFVRDRTGGGSDFFRMQQGQVFLTQFFRQAISPVSWTRLPALMSAISDSVDTNLPVWLWPRILFALLRAGSDGIDSRIISSDMVTSFTTAEGAQVLLPDWSKISPVVTEMFGP